MTRKSQKSKKDDDTSISLRNQMIMCKDLLKEMKKLESSILKSKFKVTNARWFTDPVDPIEMEIPDYFDIIKEPIDFYTIGLKLENGNYDSREAFHKDMLLVFMNAMTYNTDTENPVHIAAKELMDSFEGKYRILESKCTKSISYKDSGDEDDEFLLSESDNESTSANKNRTKRRKINYQDSSDNDSIASENSAGNDDEAELKVQYILASKSLFPYEWQIICDKMNTREVTRGSVWKQPDSEYFDKTPRKIEKFLIKWMHASFLHVSWEKEDDLVNLLDPSVKSQLKKFRQRITSNEPDLFEDLGREDYFPPSFLVIERILDVDDKDISIQSVDPIHALTSSNNNHKDSIEVDTTISPPLDTDTLIQVECVEESTAKTIDYSAISKKFDELMEFDDFDLDLTEELPLSPQLAEKEPLEKISEDDLDVSTNIYEEVGFSTNIYDENIVLPEILEIDSPVKINTRSLRPRTSKQTKKQENNSKRETSKKNDKKSNNSYDSTLLHGNECWVTIKWQGLPYSDSSIEDLNDIIAMNIEYETPMRKFYTREQKAPISKSQIRKIKRALDSDLIASPNSPNFPAGSLRDYQWDGVRWLLFNWNQKRNSILADEMGLGKTIQTAAYLQLLKTHQNLTGPFLVVAPLSTIVNWQREIETWTDMDAIIYHGSQEDRQLIREYEFSYMSRKKTDGYKIEIVITTPETCLALDNKASNHRELSHIDWEIVVIDEAHKLKNHESKFCSTIREQYSYQNCLLLTGTPLQNNTEELWTLLNFVDRNKFNDKDDFASEYGELKDANQLEKLHNLLKPYLLRREKEHVEKSVPPKEEVIIEVELTISQKQYYRAIYEQNTSFLYKSGTKDGPRLTNLAMELRKCCNHPFLVKGAEIEIIREASKDESLNNSESGYVETLIQSSGKMVLLDKLLPKLKTQGHRVLIFSQFRIMLDIIEDYLLLRQFSYERIDGAITGGKRQHAIDRYNSKDSEVFVMLLSTKAGGVGINLTSADTVIIFDSDWNPQNDLQAQARAHRIGQTKSVKVYRLLTKKSYEMHMFQTASMKLGLAYAVSGNTSLSEENTAGGKKFSSLNKKELEDLLKHGAYDIFREGKDETGEKESKDFCEADIDFILERSSVVVHDSKGSKSQNPSSNFSKASFVSSSGQENDVAIDDPEFWSKVIGLSSTQQEDLDLNRRRKCREMISEGSYKEPGMRFAVVDESDSDCSIVEPKEKRIKKSEKLPVFIKPDFSDQNAMTRLSNALSSKGYLNWDSVRKDARLKWSIEDISKGCRISVIQALLSAHNLENFDPSDLRKSDSRQSWSGVADRLSLSPSQTTEDSPKISINSNFSQDVKNLLSKMKSSRVARIAFAMALIESDLKDGEDNNTLNIENTMLSNLLSSTATNDSELVKNLSSLKFNSEAYPQLNESFYDDIIESGIDTHNLKLCNMIMTMKSICPVKATILESNEMVSINTEGNNLEAKSKLLRSKCEEKIEQLDDLFDIHLTLKLCEKSNQPNQFYLSSDFLLFIKNIQEKEDNIDQPLSIIRLNFPFWTHEFDALLFQAVSVCGWPDNKKKYHLIESYIANQVSKASTTGGSNTENSSIEKIDDEIHGAIEDDKETNNDKSDSSHADLMNKAFPNGFPFKDRSDLLKRLRGYLKYFRSDSSLTLTGDSQSKKFVNSVLKSFGKLGRPRVLYNELQKHTENINHPLRFEFDINWETIALDCGVKIVNQFWIERIKVIIESFISAQDTFNTLLKNKRTTYNGPDELLSLSEISVKSYADCMERSDLIHNIRSALIMLTDKDLVNLLINNTKIPVTGMCDVNIVPVRKTEKERERDTSLPIWWTWEYDIMLLKLVCKYGMASWKKYSTSSELEYDISKPPSEFSVPLKKNEEDTDFIFELSARSIEKRFYVLSKNINPIKWIKLEQLKGNFQAYHTIPPGSPNDKLQLTISSKSLRPAALLPSHLNQDKPKVVCSLFSNKISKLQSGLVNQINQTSEEQVSSIEKPKIVLPDETVENSAIQTIETETPTPTSLATDPTSNYVCEKDAAVVENPALQSLDIETTTSIADPSNYVLEKDAAKVDTRLLDDSILLSTNPSDSKIHTKETPQTTLENQSIKKLQETTKPVTVIIDLDDEEDKSPISVVDKSTIDGVELTLTVNNTKEKSEPIKDKPSLPNKTPQKLGTKTKIPSITSFFKKLEAPITVPTTTAESS